MKRQEDTDMMDQNQNQGTTPKRKVTSRQIVALTGVVLLALLYIVTLLVAIFAPETSFNLFMICLVCTIIVPLIAWFYSWMYARSTGKRAVGDAPESIQKKE